MLDLFAGCGGLSLGFQSEGFKIIGAVEIDIHATQSYGMNLHPDQADSSDSPWMTPRDITRTDPEDVLAELRVRCRPENAIDVIVGGPPCQAFARVGRAKLREVAKLPEAFLQDPRANLYIRYLDYVRSLRPLSVLMENVPDALNFGGHNVIQEVCETLSDIGYVCRYTLLNAAFYGVPQMRERMFMIGYAKGIAGEIEFPKPTHWVELPRGYDGTRQVALQAVRGALFDSESYYVDPPKPTPDLPPAVSAKEALEDLPRITVAEKNRLKRGARRFDTLVPYRDHVHPNAYMRCMREWPGFEGNGGVYDHVIRRLPRDYAIFARMKPGDQYPEAHQVGCNLFEERVAELAKRGIVLEPGSEQCERLRRRTVPPYDPGKFPNKWRKMESDMPVRTLMAHIGKDTYSHIHYESGQARTISVREAARLQSFPDGFKFSGTMNPAFRQIGNAVPPLMAAALARRIKETIRGVTP